MGRRVRAPPSRIIGTRIATDAEGRITGRFATPNCTGEEKVVRLEAAAGNLDDTTLYAYGDSSGDKPLLRKADFPTLLRK